MRTMKTRMKRTFLLERLPARHLSMLRQIGRLADEQGLPVYLVGGVVRDLLLKRTNWDLDLTVEGNGIAFARLVADRYRAGLVTFERFATARLVMPNGIKVDIASTRRESYARPAALPNVEPATLLEDLRRRDFTINAMAIQLNSPTFGRLHDPYGGQRDLRAKTIRMLHDGSFVDDPTRMFRAIRFAQRFGFRLESQTARLLKAGAGTDLIAQLSGPRLCNEILLLAGEAYPHRSFDWLTRLKLLRFLHPDLRYAGSTRRIVQSLPRALAWWRARCSNHPIDRSLVFLMGLLAGAEPPIIEAVATRLMLSNEQARKVRAGGTKLRIVVCGLGESRRLRPSEVYRLLKGMPDEALVLCVATVKGQTAMLARMKRRIGDYVTRFRTAKPALRGDELLHMGVEPGPAVGTMLTLLCEAKLDGVVKGKAGERAFVRTRLACDA
jgi:tRNA nucleotidyltransferase (CCA-adding enzyme)